MKSFLIIISFIFLFSISNSYTKSLKKSNVSLNSESNLTSNNASTSKSNGIDIDSNKQSKSARIEQDTSSITNEITKVYTRDNLKFFVEIKLKEDLIPIKIQIFNMLGNLVKDVHNGTVVGKEVEFNFDATNLPNGFYLCILQGPNFRDAEKFTISR